jgi:peroxiredoxin (alkyl hydroperoxide reductase subunit C)
MALVISTAFSQKNNTNNNIPLIGSEAPSFTAPSTNGTMTFPDDFGKSWKILFSHPKDFTPVCSSELLELAYMQPDLKKLNVKFAVISTDKLSQHSMWKAYLEKLDYKGHGPQKINFPIFEDPTMTISKSYGMLHSPTSTSRDIRGVYIIDPNNIVRSIEFYPVEVGRNMNEIERTIVALQTADETQLLTPADWVSGDDLLVPHYPYTAQELKDNPDLKNDYYSVGNRMWFKKMKK